MIIEASKGGHAQVVKLLLEWPNRLLLTSSVDLAHTDLTHMNLAAGGAVDEVGNIFTLYCSTILTQY